MAEGNDGPRLFGTPNAGLVAWMDIHGIQPVSFQATGRGKGHRVQALFEQSEEFAERRDEWYGHGCQCREFLERYRDHLGKMRDMATDQVVTETRTFDPRERKGIDAYTGDRARAVGRR